MDNKQIINQHRHTEESKDPNNTWGDMDCTEIVDFGTGKTERELYCRVCGFTTPLMPSDAAIVYRFDGKAMEKLT